jgi:hypothetical protein
VTRRACRGFKVAVYRSVLADSAREFPLSVVVQSAHPLIGADWSVGASAAAVRSRLGPPHSTAGESFGYLLRPPPDGRDTLTFEVEAGIVRAVAWTWEVD